MDDQQILDTIDNLHDVRERQALRAHFQREGRTAAFQDAFVAACDRQAKKTSREEAVMRPARWMARKTGGFLGRTMRKLEEQAEKADRNTMP